MPSDRIPRIPDYIEPRPVVYTYGWLFLTRRGQWFLRNGRITNQRLIQYLNEHYRYDPKIQGMVVDLKRELVVVTLEYTPWVYRVVSQKAHKTEEVESYTLLTHTQKPVLEVREGFRDEEGNLLLYSEWGIGVVCDTDLFHLIPWLQEGPTLKLILPSGRGLYLSPILSSDLPRRFHYLPKPGPTPDRASLDAGGIGDRSNSLEAKE